MEANSFTVLSPQGSPSNKIKTLIKNWIKYLIRHSEGESKLATMACSDSLAPHFAKNQYVVAEITCSTVHVHDEVLIWSRATL